MKEKLNLYSDISTRLLNRIYEALLVCVDETMKNSNSDFYSEKIIEKVSQPFYKELKGEIGNKKYNPHIREGFKLNQYAKEIDKFPRISLLVIDAFLDAQRQATYLIPSPLHILYRFLTVPGEPQSAAYSLAECRAMLFKNLKVHPEHPNLNSENKYRGFKIMNALDISTAVDSYRNHFKKSDTKSGDSSRSSADGFVGHFLAMKGILLLSFRKKNENLEKITEKIRYFLKSKNIGGEHEFKLSSNYTDIPDASAIINQTSGIPLPFRGADIIFMGGLKTTSESSLVMSVSGNSGSGKTSFALDFGSLLAPFNTKCYYISFEEEEADLKNRLASITPDYIRKLSIWEKDIDEWLYIDRQTEKFDIKDITDYVKAIRLETEKTPVAGKELELPSICPLIIVIDSINSIIEEKNETNSYNDLERFVTECRKLQAIIILLSAERLPQKSSLNYLVDLEINLNLQHTDTLDRKPNRIFQVLKTRHQGSSFGSHLFHLSGKSGFRLSPQIPSQLDKREKVIQHLFDPKTFIHTLNVIDDGNEIDFLQGPSQFIKIFQHSKIIIHGRGSSGKAGLGLKILMTPPIVHEEINANLLKQINFRERKYERRILIVSFLLSEDYYTPIKKKIQDLFRDVYPDLKCTTDTLSFYPGFLTPEDLISKITRKLDSAILDGKPFTGVLLDGLHNVFLQFPELQKRASFWPMLYSLLSKFPITVVTTFTNFSVETNNDEDNKNAETYYHPEKFEIIREGQTPFLHALVQASDFFISIDPIKHNNLKRYAVQIKGAPGQKNHNKKLDYIREGVSLSKWDKGEISFPNE